MLMEISLNAMKFTNQIHITARVNRGDSESLLFRKEIALSGNKIKFQFRFETE